jgi:hypothetical protein
MTEQDADEVNQGVQPYSKNSIDNPHARAFYSGGLLQMKPARRSERLRLVQVQA